MTRSTPTLIYVIFLLTNALLRTATAIIFLAPISAFDQVSTRGQRLNIWSLLDSDANVLPLIVFGRRSAHKSH